jgi:hypothetical protein
MVFARVSIALVAVAYSSVALSQLFSTQQTVRWRSFASGTQSNISRQSILLAGDEAVLENIWRNSCQNATPMPKVDFSKDRVVFYFAGQRKSGGFSVSVRNVLKEIGTTATLHVTELTPSRESVTTQALTNPWVAVVVDRSYLDFKVQANAVEAVPFSPFTFQTSPLSTATILWTPCWTGCGPICPQPTCYEFNTAPQALQWGSANGIQFGQTITQNNFTQRRFVLINGGEEMAGYATEVQSISQESNVTWLRIRRGQPISGNRGAFLNGVFLDQTVRNVQIETAYRAADSIIDQGNQSPFGRSIVAVVKSKKELDALLGSEVPADSPVLKKIDFQKQNLGVVSLMRPSFNISPTNIVYRGTSARFEVRQNRSVSPLASPYYLVRLPKRVNQIEIAPVKS